LDWSRGIFTMDPVGDHWSLCSCLICKLLNPFFAIKLIKLMRQFLCKSALCVIGGYISAACNLDMCYKMAQWCRMFDFWDILLFNLDAKVSHML
jgi:hypothetical protein